jgi:hypothetical protein
MANFITSSISWSGKETLDYLITPMFVGKSPLETYGISIKTGVKDKELLNYFNPVAKMTKAATPGFTGATGATYTQKEINVYKMKAEMESDGTVFFNTVFGQIQAPGNWNDLSASEQGGLLKNILTELFIIGFRSDIFRQFWLNDVYKETVSSSVQSGVADTDYNSYNGIWKKLMDNCSLTPSATQIKRVAITDGAVAQQQTVTLTGTSGTCNVNIDGVNYLATFPGGGSITTTNDAFRSSHGAALLLRGYAMTGTATIIVTATKVGQPMAVITVSTAVSGDLTGSVAATTANTAPSALGAGEAHATLLSLWNNAPAELRALEKNKKAFYVGSLVYSNLIDYLESTSWTVPGYTNLVNGTSDLQYRGIPIIEVGWDYHLDADFPHVSGYLHAYPHRVIYSALENLVLCIDGTNEFNSFDFWFNKDLEMNRWRAKMVMGAEYLHPKLMAIAY